MQLAVGDLRVDEGWQFSLAVGNYIGWCQLVVAQAS